MSLSINTTVPSAPSTKPTPLSNTLNDDEEVELMKVNSPTTTIRELHDRAAASGNVISLVSPEASPTPPLGGGGGLLFGQDDVSQFARGGMARSETLSFASTSALDSSNGAARTNTVEHRVLTNKSKSKKSTSKSKSKSKRKKSKAKTDKGTKSTKSDKGTKSTKASDTSDKGTTSAKKSKSKSDEGTNASKPEYQPNFWDSFSFMVVVVLILLPLYSLDIISGIGAIIFFAFWMGLNVVMFLDSKSKSDKPSLSGAVDFAVFLALILFLMYISNIISKIAAIISFALGMGLNVLVFLDETNKEH